MTVKDKIKERSILFIPALGYAAWGIFMGLLLGRHLSFPADTIVMIICFGFYMYASEKPLERLKAKLFPSHPDYKKGEEII